ncbi:short-chain dehydrogenase/reductase-like protein [Dendryphion nanum]|uniref:Short-chain dehydrogenase/reductase-like protein n=1 Tax=Dendryphion nanum TaxID=256645 RepID=A0A9P9I765_9PLEO|nr:short-chain dehydrogenase/reductase-like protein [Dendryphion nanum]
MPSTNKYTAAHLSTNGPGDIRPTASEILEDEGLEGQLSDKIILVTGASAGIGVETVRVLAKTGATVFAAARDLRKAEKVLAGFEGKIELIALDLASLCSVREAAAEFLNRSGGKLNILVNNAGIMALPSRTVTVDGYETQFGTNHLGHFLLFQLLSPALLRSSTPSFHSRTVILSSSAHRFSGIQPDDYNFEKTPYNEWIAYGQAKTANLYMSNAIERYYGSKGLHSLAVHPGVIQTELSRHLDPAFLENILKDPKMLAHLKSIEQGAATTVLAAVGKDYEGIGGRYVEDAGEWGPVQCENPTTEPGHALWAFDSANEDQLWKDSCKLVGIQED